MRLCITATNEANYILKHIPRNPDHQELADPLPKSHSSTQLPKGSREATKTKAKGIKPLDTILYLLLYYEDKNVCSMFVFLRQVLGDITGLIFAHCIPTLGRGLSHLPQPGQARLECLGAIKPPDATTGTTHNERVRVPQQKTTHDAVKTLNATTQTQMSHSLRPHGLEPTRLLHPWNSPSKNTGVGCHFLLQGIVPTRGLNLGLPHCRQTLYHLSHQGIQIKKNTLKKKKKNDSASRSQALWQTSPP